AGEPPSSARNSLDLLKRKDIWIRRRCCVAGEAREKTICVGRDEGSRSDSDESAEVNLDVEGHGKSSKLRGISHAAPVYDQGATLYYVSFDCRQRSSEGYLLACQRRAGEDRDQGYFRYQRWCVLLSILFVLCWLVCCSKSKPLAFDSA